jgi:hypothetical protein
LHDGAFAKAGGEHKAQRSRGQEGYGMVYVFFTPHLYTEQRRLWGAEC